MEKTLNYDQNPEAVKESTDTFKCMKQDQNVPPLLSPFLNSTALRPLYEAGKVGLRTMAQHRGFGGVSRVIYEQLSPVGGI